MDAYGKKSKENEKQILIKDKLFQASKNIGIIKMST